MILRVLTNRFAITCCFFFAYCSLATAQQVMDTVYLNENFVKVPEKATAAYVRYTISDTLTNEGGQIKTFYITGEKYSESPIPGKTLKATGYHRQWHKNGQLKYEEQIENNLPVGERKEWYDNGQLFYSYIDLGNRANALTYYRNGARKRIEVFEEGNPVRGQCFTQTGQDTIFFPHEQNPVFPGGLVKMYQYLGRNIKYPKTAVKQNVQGNVILQFVVTKTGQIENIEVVKSLHPDLDRESIRVTAGMPIWEPGRQEGIPVNVRYTLPIRFKL